ncbi:AzlC family ABC transporter permease [Nocardioides carbamazepini]|uniref:AzlC family ABC transporter permease n=1 Tax=Nocardioides carbamazepini TaxID=2854259 RepID=UPI002149FC07|nr:AzlC family ABC transporter permease [Nocardioides carbamazepini]MCR1781719.1 AzlC family ABC transporter permease [Nocardioides carbamazepini]
MGTDQDARRAVVRDSLGVAIATGTYGLSFGAVGVASGLDVAQTCALSLVMFTGASQFALVGVLGSGGTPLAGALTALLLGTRNTLYGLRMAPLLGYRGWRRLTAAHVLIDESTAMSVTRPDRDLARTGFLTTGLTIFVLWNLTTLVGAVAGERLGDPRDLGLDAAVGAAFLALLWPRLSTPVLRVTAVLASLVAAGAVTVTPAGVPVLVAAGVAVLVAVLTPRRPPPPEEAP